MKLKMEVFAQLKKLHPQAVLIVSNQGGIELGHVHPAMFQPNSSTSLRAFNRTSV